mmetsp:Transcript_2150/g.3106  ORF Transcript_2150/g.3106 Transcript_2150/m.3106 type:complete len:3148 (-) Transcript_2150:45-9488(-)
MKLLLLLITLLICITCIYTSTEINNVLMYTTQNSVYLATKSSFEIATTGTLFSSNKEYYFGMTSKTDISLGDIPEQVILNRETGSESIQLTKGNFKEPLNNFDLITNNLDETSYPIIVESTKDRLIYVIYNSTDESLTLYGRQVNGLGTVDSKILSSNYTITYDVSHYDEETKELYFIHSEDGQNDLVKVKTESGPTYGDITILDKEMPTGRIHFMNLIDESNIIMATETQIYRVGDPYTPVTLHVLEPLRSFYGSLMYQQGDYLFFISTLSSTGENYKYTVVNLNSGLPEYQKFIALSGAPSHFAEAKKPIVTARTNSTIYHVGEATSSITLVSKFDLAYVLDQIDVEGLITIYESDKDQFSTKVIPASVFSQTSLDVTNFQALTMTTENVDAISVDITSDYIKECLPATFFVHTCTENRNYPVVNITVAPKSFCHDYYCNSELGSLGCSNNGFCNITNTCICDETHYSYNCSQHKCFGIAHEDAQVCSSHGTCTGVNTCNCEAGYHDSMCNVTECYSILQNSPSTCSAHGVCSSLNNCSCETGYIEDDCRAHTCDNIHFEDNTTCSSHGSCISLNNCSCQIGYTGINCEFPICYGTASNLPNTCGGHGTCLEPDSCQCNNDAIYSGPNCDEQVCFGIRHTNGDVCSGNGTCTSPGQCVCNAGYFGENCQVPKCFSFLANHTNACSRHGNCTHRDTCKCEPTWAGSECEIPRCYGVPSNLPSVCSSHGNCPSVDTCNCDNDYVGENCQHAVCYGKNATNPSVCSSHGDCNLANDCTCNSKYHGTQCEHVDCFGILETSPSVCQGRGSCVGPDICNCTQGYAGSSCQYYVCNGLHFGQPGLCSDHGSCINIDTCYCQNNYYGSYCQNTYCFGIESTSNTVCTSKGNCTAFDTCTCENGYSGDRCQFEAVCATLNASNPNACSGNGQCIRDEECVCNEGFYGTYCGEPTCYGIKHENSSVCHGKGNCVQKDNCDCIDGWTGDCSVPTCGGISSENDNVCSSYGDCVGPNQCSCHNETLAYGTNCDQFRCYGIFNFNTDVCSGHGSCNRIDQCTCQTHYSGPQCNNFTCYGEQKSSACGLHGDCTGHDTCTCHSDDTLGHWAGAHCDQCQYNFEGENCTERICTDDGTCNSNGVCNQNLTCDCFDSDQQGHFRGDRCDQCTDNYFGDQCKDFCSGPTHCNTRGICVSNEIGSKPYKCSCNASRTTGFWFGESCERCHPEFFGVSCRNSIPSVFNFSSTNDRLVAKVFTASDVTNLDCDKLFHPGSYDLLGENPVCRYTDIENGILEIIFGSNPKIYPGDQVIYNLVATEEGAAPKYYGIPTVPAANPQPPTANFRSPSIVGVCSDFEPDASSSFTPDRRPLKYHWLCISGSNKTKINEILSDTTQTLPVIPSALLNLNEMYQFSLQVENFLGIKSTLVLKEIYKSSKAVPFARIRGPPIQNAPAVGYFALDGTSKASDCMFSSDNVGFNWTQVGGPTVPLNMIANNKKLVLSNLMSVGNTYEFEMKVYIKGDPLAYAVARTRVTVVPSKLVTIIDGGDRNILSGTPLVLNGSSSYDPDQSEDTPIFSWSCSRYPIDGACPNFPYGSLNSPVGVVDNMPAGNYRITLTYQKGGRVTKAEALVNILLSRGPTVRILNVPGSHLTQNSLRLRSNISSTSPETLTYTWRVWERSYELVIDKLITTPKDSPFISFRPYALKPGATYKIGLFANDENGGGYSTIELYVYRPPRLGTINVSPSSGYALDTFKISPINFVSDFTGTSHGLKYGFYYYDLSGKKILLIQETVANTVWVKIPTHGNKSNDYKVKLQMEVSDEIQSRSFSTFEIQIKPLLAKAYDLNQTVLSVLHEATNVTEVQKQLKNTEERVRSLYNIAKGLTISTDSFTLPSLEYSIKKNISMTVNGSIVTEEHTFNEVKERVVNITSSEIEEVKHFVENFKDAIVKQVIVESTNDEAPKSKLSVQQELMVLGASLEQVQLTSNASRTRSLDHIESLYETNADKFEDDDQLKTILEVSESVIKANTFNISSPYRNGIDNTPLKEMIQGPNGTLIEKNNTIKTYGDLYEESKPPSEAVVNATRRLYEMVNKVADSLVDKQFPDQQAHVIHANGISISAFVQSPSRMQAINENTSTLVEATSQNSLKVSLSPDIAYETNSNETRSENIEVKMITFPENPNPNANNAKFQASSYLRLHFSSNKKELKVQNLTTPLVFSIPGSFDIKKMELHPKRAGYKPLCAFYNTVNETFDTTGCRVLNVYPTHVDCACNHATDFMSLVSYVLPELDFLTFEDVTKITNLNQDNMETTIVLAILLNIYIVIMGVLEVIYFWSQRASKKLKLRLESEKTILQRGWCYKQGGSIKSWKNRYMKLTSTSLTYGKNNEYTINQIMTKYIKGITKTIHKTAPKGYTEYGLSIRCETDEIERIYRLAFKSEEQQLRWYEAVRESMDHSKVRKSNEEKRGIIRPFFETLRDSHLWLSVIFLPARGYNYTKSQRVTVIYLLILGIMASNAMSFQAGYRDKDYVYGGSNETKYILTGYVADLITQPFALFIAFLFAKLRANKKELVQEDFNVEDFLNEVKLNRFWVAKEDSGAIISGRRQIVPPFLQTSTKKKEADTPPQFLPAFPSTVVQGYSKVNSTPGTPVDSPIQTPSTPVAEGSPEDENNKMFLPAFPNQTSVPKKTVVNLDLQDSDDSEDIDPNFWADERPTDDDVKLSRFDGIKKNLGRIFDIFIDRVDDVLYFILSIVKRVDPRIIGVITLIIATVLYFACVAAGAVVMYTISWLGIIAITVFVTQSTAAYVGVMFALYLKAKIRTFYKDPSRQWRGGTAYIVNMVISFIILFASILGCILTLSVGPWILVELTKVDKNVFQNVGLLMVTYAFFSSIVGIFVIWIWRHIRVPSKRPKSKFRRLLTKKWFPWWFKYPVYLLAFLMIATFCFVLTLYGIKFSEDDNSDISGWYFASSCATGQNIGLDETLKFVINSIVVVTILNLFDLIFFQPRLRKILENHQEKARTRINAIRRINYDNSALNLAEIDISVPELEMAMKDQTTDSQTDPSSSTTDTNRTPSPALSQKDLMDAHKDSAFSFDHILQSDGASPFASSVMDESRSPSPFVPNRAESPFSQTGMFAPTPPFMESIYEDDEDTFVESTDDSDDGDE